MNWKPIVAGVDGSDASVRAATIAAMIARRAGVRCQLVYAMPDYARMLQREGLVVDVATFAAGAQRNDRDAVLTSLQGQVPDELRDGLLVMTGRPGTVIRQAAEELDAGLIVLGSRKRRHDGWLWARLARYLARATDIPLLVGEGGSPVIHRILVALDLSPASRRTWDTATAWAGLFGAELRALHVDEPMLPMIGPTLPLAAATPYVHALQRSELWAGIADAQKTVRTGPPAEAITEEAAEWRADLVIVGSHGHGWTDRMLLGGTAEQLMHHPPALTLVVPSALPGATKEPAPALPWEEPLGSQAGLAGVPAR